MASASGTSSTSATSLLSGRNRMAGLMSGLDTESLVKAMAANTKNRLNSKKQKLQTLQWKQEGYRSVVSKIQSFQDKFLKIDSKNSIKAYSSLNKFKSDVSNDKVVANASSTALPATYYIKNSSAATAASIESSGSVSADKITLDFSANVEDKEYTVKMTFDGTQRDVVFKGGADADASKANFLAAVNDTFKDIKTDAQSFSFKDGTADLVFNGGDDGIYHTFDVGYNKEAVGLVNTASSRMALGSSLGSIGFAKNLQADADGNYNMTINGKEFKFTKDSTISDVVNTINNSDAGVKMTFSSVTQSFKMEATKTGTAGHIEISQKDSNLANVLFNTDADLSQAVYGKNGTLTISTDGTNYRTYTSANNSYTFDGTTIDIAKLGEFDADASGVEPITVTTSKDTSSIKDTVVKFIDDYNTLINDLYTEIKTARPKKSGSYYDPLTEEQEEEMEKDEIEKWNEEAKKGLLYRDGNIQNFLSSIRSAMSSSVEGFSLSDMGITVSSKSEDFGKLIIDEEKLEASIEKYSDQISKFFTDADNGLAAKVNNVVDKAISKKTNNYGYLTMIVGFENTDSEKKSQMYSQISGLQDLISNLEKKYQNEMERYWKQFSTLETYMNKMQSQSSIFASDY